MTADGHALDLLAAFVMEDERRWGDVVAPWQINLGKWLLDADGTPSRWESRPRGGSKTTDISAILLAALVTTLPAGSRCYVAAVDRDQAALIIDAASGFVARTPALANELTVTNLRVTARSGSVLQVLAADADSAWGLRPAIAVCDEFCQWPNTRNAKNFWQAISSAMGKVRGSRLLVASTSGDPAHWTRPIYLAAKSLPSWEVQDVPGPLPWVPESFLAEQRVTLPASSYARLHLNQWTEGEDRLTDETNVRACATLSGPLDPISGNRYVVGLDLGLMHDRTVGVVMHSERVETEGRIIVQRYVLDRMEVWAGTRKKPVDLAAVEEWVLTTARAFRARVVVDPWQAQSLVQRLRSLGLPVEEFLFSQQSTGRIAMTLHTTIRDHRLAIPDDPALIDELLNVRLRETSPNIFRLDHDPDQHDDRAVALGIALVALTTSSSGARPFLGGDADESTRGRSLSAIGRPDIQQPYGLSFVGSFAREPWSYDPDEVGRTKPSPFA